MKIAVAILALSALHPSTAFVAPSVVSFKNWKNPVTFSPSFSYLSGLGGSADDSSFSNTTKSEALKVGGDMKTTSVQDDSYAVRAPKPPSQCRLR